MNREQIERCFPRLRTSDYEITSPFDEGYNCIAFAAQDEELRWWWPSHDAGAYWPPDAPRQTTLRAFRLAFEAVGYETSDSGTLEPGFQKIALFVDAVEIPTHAARQLSDGTWASKLGKCEDIRHHQAGSLDDTPDGPRTYGRIALYMKRALRR